MVFYWSLSVSKSLQVPRTLLSILAGLSNVVIIIIIIIIIIDSLAFYKISVNKLLLTLIWSFIFIRQ